MTASTPPRRSLAPEQEKVVRSAVVDSVIDMITSCGVPAGELDAGRMVSLSEHDIAGVIGFSGTVRGSLIIAGSSRVFAITFPPTPGAPGRTFPELLDWAGEMANQTLGRIKRRFCERGIDFESSTPTSLKGRHIGTRSPLRDGIIEIALIVADEVISICFEIESPAGGDIFKTPAEPIPCSREGDLVLF
jgi:CheY-specific phosphatase CheX